MLDDGPPKKVPVNVMTAGIVLASRPKVLVYLVCDEHLEKVGHFPADVICKRPPTVLSTKLEKRGPAGASHELFLLHIPREHIVITVHLLTTVVDLSAQGCPTVGANLVAPRSLQSLTSGGTDSFAQFIGRRIEIRGT